MRTASTMKLLLHSLAAILLPAALYAQDLPVKEPEAAQAAAAGTQTLWTLIVLGGPAMIILGIMSLIAVMLVIAYVFTMRRGSILTRHFMHTADILLKKRDYMGLLAISSRHHEAIARVVQRTLDFATKNPSAPIETVREIALVEGQAHASSLQQRAVYLADIGVLAPMVGLLGTVVGIIKAFGEIAEKSDAATRPQILSGGVAEALIATGAGLVLGIICMAFYGIFRGRAQSLISDLEIATAHILGLMTLNYTRKREPARTTLGDDEF